MSDTPAAHWVRLVASLLVLAVLGWVLWRPLYGDPAPLPDRIRAVEGSVWIPDTRGSTDTAYVLETQDGRRLALHCGPAGHRARCLENAGLRPGYAYRLTIAYGAEPLVTGGARNVMTHVVFDDEDLLTPLEQAWSWSDRNAVDRLLRESGRARRGTGAYFLLGCAFILALAAFLKSAFRLVEPRT